MEEEEEEEESFCNDDIVRSVVFPKVLGVVAANALRESGGY